MASVPTLRLSAVSKSRGWLMKEGHAESRSTDILYLDKTDVANWPIIELALLIYGVPPCP